jgi:hypothetical protein
MTDSPEPKPVIEMQEYASEKGADSEILKLDPYGYPLRPQPSDDPLGQILPFCI